MSTNKLVWEDKYSVGVEEIDLQHKQLFAIINELLEAINIGVTEEKIKLIITSLVNYKKNHFATEENYFKKFNYEGAGAHIKEHEIFSAEIGELQNKYPQDLITFAFKLADYIEDWLIRHLMNEDQKYVKCFQEHGLK